MYDGPSGDVEKYFADRGFPVLSSNINVADWILEVSQENSCATLKERGFFQREMTPMSVLSPSSAASDQCTEPVRLHQKRLSIATEISELFFRELLIAKRDPLPRVKEVGTIAILSLLLGIVYEGVGKSYLDDPEAFASHVGVVFTVIFAYAMLAMTSITSTVNSRSRFCREYVSGHYRLFSYIVVMSFFELGFVCVCGLVSALIIYWTVCFNGRFVHVLGIVLAYGAVMSTLGFAFTSLFDVADHAQSHVPLVVAPQLLLSGFLVTRHSLSPWIRWMIWLQPLTYSFRLMLNEEFSACQEISDDNWLHLNCLKAFQAGLSAVETGDHTAVYSDESVLTLMQGGKYVGARAILEYFAFLSSEQTPLSLLWDHCTVRFTCQHELYLCVCVGKRFSPMFPQS